MMLPSIQWTDGVNNGTVLFLYPPTKRPYRSLEATRTDSYSTSGVKQSVWLRTDNFLLLNMDNVMFGDEIESWSAFIDYAITGGAFTYFEDANNPDGGVLYSMEDTSWDPQFAFFKHYKFNVKFRKVVAG